MLPATAPSDCLISPIVVEADVFAFVAPVIFVAAIPDVVLIVAINFILKGFSPNKKSLSLTIYWNNKLLEVFENINVENILKIFNNINFNLIHLHHIVGIP